MFMPLVAALIALALLPQANRSVFADHSDKLIFWTELGKEIAVDSKICGVIYIGEVWLRSV